MLNKSINSLNKILSIHYGIAISALCFPTVPSNSLILCVHWLGVPWIYLNSDAIYLEIVSYFTGLGLGPTRLLSLQMPVASPGCYLSFQQTTVNQWFPQPPSLGSIHLLKWLTDFRETFTYIYQLITKDMIKDTNKQSDEEIHRARSGRVLRARSSVFMELRCTTLWHKNVFTSLEVHQFTLFNSVHRTLISNPFPFPWRCRWVGLKVPVL